MNELKYESLHSHTTISDGKQTHMEVLFDAEEFNVGTVAFTDHDVLPDKKIISHLHNYTGPVDWVFGIEITSGLPKEMDEESSVHILGLFIDPTNKDLVDYTKEMQESRLRRLNHYLEHFHSLGLEVTKNEVISIADGSPVGSPHMVSAIYSHKDNLKRIDELLEEFKRAAEQDEELKEKYEQMKAQGDNQIPYRLFMTKHSFKPVPEGNYRKKLLDLDETVDLIHNAEGIAIFAHWFYEKEDISADKIAELVKDGRIDGLETDSENSITKHTHGEDVKFLRELVNEHGCLETLGADSHGRDDFEAYSKSQAAKRSVGHTSKLIKKAGVNTKWSSING